MSDASAMVRMDASRGEMRSGAATVLGDSHVAAAVARHHDKLPDLALLEGVEEAFVVLEGDATMRFRPAAAQKVAVGQEAVAAMLVPAVDRQHADGLDAVKALFAHLEIVGVRRRRPVHLDMRVA